MPIHDELELKMRPKLTDYLVGAALGLAAVSATNISLPQISTHPSNASQILDPRLASFSFELAYLPSFTGNKSNPNTLTAGLMQRLVERTGVGPDIRPGGITMFVPLSSSLFSRLY